MSRAWCTSGARGGTSAFLQHTLILLMHYWWHSTTTWGGAGIVCATLAVVQNVNLAEHQQLSVPVATYPASTKPFATPPPPPHLLYVCFKLKPGSYLSVPFGCDRTRVVCESQIAPCSSVWDSFWLLQKAFYQALQMHTMHWHTCTLLTYSNYMYTYIHMYSYHVLQHDIWIMWQISCVHAVTNVYMYM